MHGKSCFDEIGKKEEEKKYRSTVLFSEEPWNSYSGRILFLSDFSFTNLDFIPYVKPWHKNCILFRHKNCILFNWMVIVPLGNYNVLFKKGFCNGMFHFEWFYCEYIICMFININTAKILKTESTYNINPSWIEYFLIPAKKSPYNFICQRKNLSKIKSLQFLPFLFNRFYYIYNLKKIAPFLKRKNSCNSAKYK